MNYDLKKSLKKLFGFDNFKGNQQEIIQTLIDGQDVFVLMPTGGGKSLCYQLPAMLLPGTAIVISPLIALMKNQVDAIRGFSEEDGIAHFINSSLSRAAIAKVKSDITAGITKMLYVAPETLGKEENSQFLRTIPISFFAIDEAHCISEWGHDFRPEYQRIRNVVDQVGRAPIIALTATAPPKVQHDILRNLNIQNAKVFKSSFNRPNLFYEVKPKNFAARDIIRILKNNPGKSAIVYCLSRKTVEDFAKLLEVNGIKALPYHAGLDANTRAANQDAFLLQKIDVVCATIAFGMGIDKPDVRYVFHYDIPKSLEGYYQETGRAGRDGGEGRCIAYYSRKDVQKLEKFMQDKDLQEQQIGRQLIAETVSYAESNQCRRKTLLSYFGEQYTQDNCGYCDNCIAPKERFNAREAVELLINVVGDLNNKYDTEYITDILLGVATDNIKSYSLHRHELFGKGADHDRRYWTSVIRQSLVEGYIAKDIEKYGLLHLGPNADKLDTDKSPIMFCIDREFNGQEDEELTVGSPTSALDEGLLHALKQLRLRMAEKNHTQPGFIFADYILDQMATFYPIKDEEFLKLMNVNETQLKKYGKPFQEFIAKYVKENEIERPQDFFYIKTIAKKSSKLPEIISGIDRHTPLDTLADNLGITMDELLNEIEKSIIRQGKGVKLDYYLYDRYDQDSIEDVLIYFKEAPDPDIHLAMKEFSGDDYPEELIRLVKIKFSTEEGQYS
mgnify:CR=1 FL=1